MKDKETRKEIEALEPRIRFSRDKGDLKTAMYQMGKRDGMKIALGKEKEVNEEFIESIKEHEGDDSDE